MVFLTVLAVLMMLLSSYQEFVYTKSMVKKLYGEESHENEMSMD